MCHGFVKVVKIVSPFGYERNSIIGHFGKRPSAFGIPLSFYNHGKDHYAMSKAPLLEKKKDSFIVENIGLLY